MAEKFLGLFEWKVWVRLINEARLLIEDFTSSPCLSPRSQVFYEEELDVPLVLFDEVLEHVLRIDRIFRQPQGHLLLIGVSGTGKTTLSRFVAWIVGLSVFQVKVHNKYTADDFDEDLRGVLRRAGCRVSGGGSGAGSVGWGMGYVWHEQGADPAPGGIQYSVLVMVRWSYVKMTPFTGRDCVPTKMSRNIVSYNLCFTIIAEYFLGWFSEKICSSTSLGVFHYRRHVL